VETLQRGENAGMFTSVRTFTEHERARFAHFIQNGYEQFVTQVAEGRGMTFEAVDAIAQGKVWTGAQALEVGLVDQLGGMETAVAVIKERLDIPNEDDVHLIDFPQPGNPFELFLKHLRETSVAAQLPDELRHLRARLEVLARLQDERFFAWFPYQQILIE
ncbi:hypothetical protein GF339_04240, partial [candidate division KSB3 bacterium]|nr:hypothetical protein [candidate division KSB3 bacterium]MBD3323769.1 hypothetical protein [candidate division KSB3 bacterium]